MDTTQLSLYKRGRGGNDTRKSKTNEKNYLKEVNNFLKKAIAIFVKINN